MVASDVQPSTAQDEARHGQCPKMMQDQMHGVQSLTAKYSSSFFISFVTLTSDELPSSDTVNRLRTVLALIPARVRSVKHITCSKGWVREWSKSISFSKGRRARERCSHYGLLSPAHVRQAQVVELTRMLHHPEIKAELRALLCVLHPPDVSQCCP